MRKLEEQARMAFQVVLSRYLSAVIIKYRRATTSWKKHVYLIFRIASESNKPNMAVACHISRHAFAHEYIYIYMYIILDISTLSCFKP